MKLKLLLLTFILVCTGCKNIPFLCETKDATIL